MRPAANHDSRARRGLTLVELLVSVALMLIIMVIIVQVFQSATGAINVAQVDQELTQTARRIDTVLRQDLIGATARFTPPLNPRDNLGYFEYGENSFADVQGDDTDDYLAFTVKAPEGQPFSGRVMVRRPGPGGVPPFTYVSVTITSQFAEVLYFLRNGNLYRRVLLIDPDRTLYAGTSASGTLNAGGAFSNLNADTPAGQIVSWQGANDISARPSTAPPSVAPGFYPPQSYAPIANTLADLTNRENRIYRPRFANDYDNNAFPTDPNAPRRPDGKPDDADGNGVDDYYPTVTPHAALTASAGPTGSLLNNTSYPTTLPNGNTKGYDQLGFPFLFPGAYSNPLNVNVPPLFISPLGSVHILNPNPTSGLESFPINHDPLEIGDSLATPGLPSTWWGFPTWRESLSPRWTHPIKRPNDPPGSTYLLRTFAPNEAAYTQSRGLSLTIPPPFQFLPPTRVRYSDGAGGATFGEINNTFESDIIWQDDLLATGVRSFDVKAYDGNAYVYSTGTFSYRSGYYDLGYAGREAGFLNAAFATAELPGFGHEGRIPPLTSDFRPDAQWPTIRANLGDNDTSVLRMRRVWDSWSTDYTNAPSAPLDPTFGAPFDVPTYPSYPAPYPAPLRGLQIVVKLVDPDGQRVKSITIRQDFTSRL